MMKEKLNFKIDLQLCKNSLDGKIISKVKDFQQQIKIHDEHGLIVYSKPPFLTGCDREVIVKDHLTGENKKMLMFGSNSYIDATRNKACVEKSLEVIKEFGIGSGGVPLLSGTTIYQTELEKELSNLAGFEDTMLFSSGFTANMGAILGLVRPNNLLIFDKLNHASLIDGAMMSGAPMLRYLHSDMKALEKLLSENYEKHKDGMMIVTDGVFSMDGDLANLPEIVRLAKKYDAFVLIDEAHATGVVGDKGAGTLSHYGITERDNIILTGTLSKAIGAVGGYVSASKEIIDYLRVYARSNLYSTSLPPNVCASATEVIKYFRESDVIDRLMANSDYLKDKLKKMGYNTLESVTPIVPLIIGDEYVLTAMAKDIYDHNIFVNYIFPPVVPRRSARIRAGVMASHTKEDLDYFCEVMEIVGKKYGVI